MEERRNEEAINGSDKSMTMKTEEERIKTQHQKQGQESCNLKGKEIESNRNTEKAT